MATVYEAEDLKHHRKVAIKVVDPQLGKDVDAARFLREIRVTAALHHPHILPLHDSGACGDVLYYVMPFVDDGSLRDRIRNGPLPVKDAVRIASQVCSALDHAHRQGFVHRDIKPANILLQDGEALVSDFGIAHALERVTDDESPAAPRMSPGTPHYMSPEQVTGESKIDGRSDIFALGCVLYEMLSGERPFGGGKHTTMTLRVTETAPDISRKRPDLPEHVRAAIVRALARRPEDRFESAREFSLHLDSPIVPRGTTVRKKLSRRAKVLASASLVFLLAAASVFVYRQKESAVTTPVVTTVALFPFEVQGRTDIQYLREGIPDLLATSLNGAGDIRSVDSRAMFSVLDSSESGNLDEKRARQLAARLYASVFVLGSVVAQGDRVRIRAKAFRAESSNVGDEIIIDGSDAQMFALLDSLAVRLVGTVSKAPAQHLVQIASATTSSFPALKRYLSGASALRRQKYDSAIIAFREVTEMDTTFALAYYGLSLAAEYDTNAELARRAALHADRFADRVPGRDRSLIEALATSRRGDFQTAERLFSEIVEESPDNVDAWFQLGEIRFHAGPRIGLPVSRSKSAFERVLAYEPSSTLARTHLARIAASEGNTRALDSLVSSIMAIAPDAYGNIAMRSLQAFAKHDSAQIAVVLKELVQGGDMDVFSTTSLVAAYLHDLDAAARTARAGAKRSDAPQRAIALAMLAHVEAGRGRWTSARAALDSMSMLYPLQALEHRAVLSLIPILSVSRPDLEGMRDSLLRIDAHATVLPDYVTSYYTMDMPIHPQIRNFLVGMLNARLGNTVEVRRIADELEREPGDDSSHELFKDFAHTLRGAAETNPARKLDNLARVKLGSWFEFSLYSPFWSLADARFARAMALSSLGRDRESLDWLNSFADFSLYDSRYQAPAHLEIARVWARRGRNDLSALHYRKFLDLWRNADAQFQPVVAQAQRELSAIRSSEN